MRRSRVKSPVLLALVVGVLFAAPAQAVADTYFLTVTAGGFGGGEVSVKKGSNEVCKATPRSPCEREFADGTQVTLTATADSGSTFKGYTNPCGTSPSCTLTVDDARDVTADFDAPVKINSPVENQVYPSDAGSVPVSVSGGRNASLLCANPDDSGSYGGCPASFSGLTTGSHYLEVIAQDQDGNLSSPVRRNFKVVRLGTAGVGGTPAAGSVTNSRSTAFTYTGTNGATLFRCKLDASTTVLDPCPSAFSGLGDGTHSISVAAGVVFEGNPYWGSYSSPSAYSWTVDATPPDTTLTADGPAQDSATTQTGAVFHFASTESGSTFECALDSDSFGGCPGGTPGQASYAGLGPGQHTFRVRAIDSLGNVDASPAVRGWRVITDTSAGGDGGASQTTGASGSTTVLQPQLPAAASLPRVKAAVTASWKRAGKLMRVRKLAVSGVPAGGAVTVTCSGGGCPRKLKAGAPARGKVDLTKLFKKAKLKKNAVVVVKVTAPGMIGKVVTYTVKPPKTPTPVTLCLSPGATAPAAC